MLRKSKLGLMEASGCLGHGLELFCLGFVGGVLGLCEVDGKADARRERISAWQGLRRVIQLRFREMAKTIAAGPELASGSNS